MTDSKIEITVIEDEKETNDVDQLPDNGPSVIAPTTRFWGPVRDPDAAIGPSEPPPVVYSSTAPQAPTTSMISLRDSQAFDCNYICRHCHSNLSTGNIFQAMKNQFPVDPDEINDSRARSFGWTPETPLHFFRIVRETQDRDCIFVCPECNKKNPFVDR